MAFTAPPPAHIHILNMTLLEQQQQQLPNTLRAHVLYVLYTALCAHAPRPSRLILKRGKREQDENKHINEDC